MHQHQLLVYATRFNLFPPHPPSNAPSYTAPGYDAEMHTFLPPVESVRQLSTLQFKHLQQHYKTVHDSASLQDREPVNMDPTIQVWRRYRQDKTIFHCVENRRRNSTRLNHLACFRQTINKNARFSYQTRPEQMEFEDFYVYIEFYCVHMFRGLPSMLEYGRYHKVSIHDGLVEDLGATTYVFCRYHCC